MNTGIDSSTEDATPRRSTTATRDHIHANQSASHLPINAITLILVAIVALIPRIILATQLDMVTDEVVYILGGKIYLPLIAHLNIHDAGWTYNYEHPPFVKFLMGISLAINSLLGHPVGTLFAGRIPSIIFGTLLVVAIYWLGKAPFGRTIALAAALCLAFSPWLVYFSALAYLDMTMTALITIAYLLLWHAIRRPWLYPVLALLVGLGAASKYTAVLVVPAIVLFTVYYYFVLRFRMAKEERPAIPWLWWISAIVIAPLIFLIIDVAIWRNPISLLVHSFQFEWDHSVRGHLTFLAGQYSGHVPQWSILYILMAKISAFVTFSAIFFAIFTVVQLVRFHLRRGNIAAEEMAKNAYLFIWLICIVGMFSMLNIVVGTHYHLPAAPPVALAGACGLATIVKFVLNRVKIGRLGKVQESAEVTTARTSTVNPYFNPYNVVLLLVLLLALAVPHLIGLVTVPDAEGYTSELFPNENAALQVAYPGYRDAVKWLAENTNQPANVGLVALPHTLDSGGQGISWYDFNKDLPKRFTLAEAHPTDTSYSYDYLVWPMHLIQRGYPIPQAWRAHVVHIVQGGGTIYCYILARPTGKIGTPGAHHS